MNWIKLTGSIGRGVERTESPVWYDADQFYSMRRVHFTMQGDGSGRPELSGKITDEWDATVIWGSQGRFQEDVAETPEEVLALMRKGERF